MQGRQAEEDKSGAKGKEEGKGRNAINGGRKEKKVPKLQRGGPLWREKKCASLLQIKEGDEEGHKQP